MGQAEPRFISVLFLLVVTATAVLRAEPKWIRMQSPNFDVLSSAASAKPETR